MNMGKRYVLIINYRRYLYENSLLEVLCCLKSFESGYYFEIERRDETGSLRHERIITSVYCTIVRCLSIETIREYIDGIETRR